MNTSNPLHSDSLRVTSIPYVTADYVIFSGVPLKKNSYRINNGKYYITIKSDASVLPVAPAIGQQWEVSGRRLIDTVESGDHLMQQHTYEAPVEVRCTLPEDGEQLIRFIAKEKDFRGIGEQKARALWERLGADFHATLSKDTPESRSLLRDLLSEESVDALYTGYAKYKNLEACNWMAKLKIPAPIQQRLLKYHDDRSVQSINDNPYLLMGFGMSFDAVDTLTRQHFDVDDCDPKRLSAAVEMAIRKEIEKGHTYTTQSAIRPTVRKLLGSPELATQAFMAGHQKAQFVLNWEAGTYHPTAQLLMESVVAKRLLKLAAQRDLYDHEANQAYLSAVEELPYELTKKQALAVANTLDNAVSCITGGAGTGKTTVLRTALRAYHALGYSIHAVALSGRAAMRLHETIGFKTMTIARFLRQEVVESSGDQPHHLLVIDEASMIDLPTMYRLVTHISPKVRIILTGDPDQLPPIGCGKVLSDIVESEVIVNTTLDIVKRQEGSTGIPEYSKLINQGIAPERLSTGAISFHETPDTLMAERCTELFLNAPHNSRIMGATKATVAEINKRVQSAANPDGQRLEFELHGERFYRDTRQGDAILFTQNNYDKGIQNGSLGTLVSTEAVGEHYGVVELDTGDRIDVTQSLLDCMELGYCITLHKAQGSQFPRIIIALQRGRIVDRAWLYTAITRAEAEIHIVGAASDLKAITESVSNAHRRNSHLVNLLRQDKNHQPDGGGQKTGQASSK
jgi:exodeoxyribonuclease V alpha subunit